MKTQKLYFDTFVKWMFCFAGFAGLSLFWALSISNAAYRYQTLVINFTCVYCLLVYIKDRPERINLILNTLIFAPIILEMRVVMSYGLFAFQHIRNLDGIMSSNLIGMRAGIAAVLGTYFFLNAKKHKMIYLICIALNAATAILSGSRKALLFMLIPLILYYIFRQKNSIKIIRNVMFAVVLIGVTYYAIMNIPFVYDMVGYRIESMIYGLMGGETDGSTSLRLKMITWGLEWFMLKPWFGYGINNYMSLIGEMHTYAGTTGVYAHNNYIEMLVDVGMIGTAIYYFIYLMMLEKIVH
ncbi:MAG: O-antigen ligase family protein, partial [Syntrophomonas sp.]